jgi:hypothetical protein
MLGGKNKKSPLCEQRAYKGYVGVHTGAVTCRVCVCATTKPYVLIDSSFLEQERKQGGKMQA